MKTLFEHIERAKRKPHHIRKRIVFGVAGLCTALIALIWLVGNLSFGTFAIQGSNFAASTEQAPVITTDGETDNTKSGLAGAAAALPDANAPAHIEIVDTKPATSSAKKAEPTILPF